MATDVERLIVALEARTKAFENALARANSTADKRAKAIEKRFAAMNSNVSSELVGLGRGFVAAFAGSRIVREFVRFSESATRIDNSLKVAGLSGSELERVYRALSKAAKENGAPIEALAGLYGKAAQAQKELGVTTDELILFSSNVALALRVAGTDAQSASGALLQLGQALGSGKVQAEEFNSVLEGAPTIAQAVAAGLKEAGGSVSRLKALVVDGKVSSEAFFRGFEAGAVILEEKAAHSASTLDQATTNLSTALTDVMREFINATGASKNFAEGINGAAAAIGNFDVGGLIQKIRDVRAELDGFLQDAGNAALFQRWNEMVGTTNAEGAAINPDVTEAQNKIAGLEREVELLQQRIELNPTMGIDNGPALARLAEVRAELAKVRAEAANLPATVGYTIGEGGLQQTSVGNFRVPFNPLPGDVPPDLRAGVKTRSLAEFKAPGGGKSGGRRGPSGSARENDFEREVEQIKERTAALQAETAAQALINPLVEDYGFTMERVRSAHDLLTAAQKAGTAAGKELKDVQQLLSGNFEGLSPKAREQARAMLELAGSYASAVEASERLKDSQDRVRDSIEEVNALGKDVLGGLIRDLQSGKSASEALAGALEKVADKLLDIGLDSLFGGSGGGGSLFGNLLGGLFGGGGGFRTNTTLGSFLTSGFSGGAPAAGAGRSLAAIPLPSAGRLPTQMSVPQAAAAGGHPQAVDISVVSRFDANGNFESNVERVADRRAAAHVNHYDRTRAGQTAVKAVQSYQERFG